MHPPLLSPQPKTVLLLNVLLFLSSPLYSYQYSSINLGLFPSTNFTLDYGRIMQDPPVAILEPKTPEDISLLLKSISSSSSFHKITVAPRGAGHSTYGQAQALGGIVVNMLGLPSSFQLGQAQETNYIDVGGGALWVEVLRESLKYGLTPRSWTDYLYLTVGGTLSVGGISGQAFKHGPQISNVLEMDVITGKGEQVTCSKEENSDLFYGVLGGLGQLGIITRARIILEAAPKMVKWVRASYDSFDQFTSDEELLISIEEVDYLEGFIKFGDKHIDHSFHEESSHLTLNTKTESGEEDVYFIVEFAIYYDDPIGVTKTLNRILRRLSFIPSSLYSIDVSYFDFLNRVRAEEEKLMSRGLWEVAHPWLNLFVPRSHIKRFKDLLLETVSESPTDGPMILYPSLKHKWNPRMSAVLPEVEVAEDIIYVASILRSAPPSCTRGSACLASLLCQNQKIIDLATSKPSDHLTEVEGDDVSQTTNATTTVLATVSSLFNEAAGVGCQKEKREVEVKRCKGGMGAKQYIPYWHTEDEWRVHFGNKWERFSELKSRFDPLNILAPGQRIFKRKSIEG